MKSTGNRVAALCLLLPSSLFLAVLAGMQFAHSPQSVGNGIAFLVIAFGFGVLGFGLADQGGAGYVSGDGIMSSLTIGQVYVTISCVAYGEVYAAIVRSGNGYLWACTVSKPLPPIFTVSSGKERYVAIPAPSPVASNAVSS